MIVSGFHSAGAVLLDAIYRTHGREAAMAVLRDPRTLLRAYRIAAQVLVDRGEPARSVDAALAAARAARPGDVATAEISARPVAARDCEC
jgi:hypothetical protein